MEVVKSRDNKRVKYIRSLLEKNSIRKKENRFVVEGIKLADEALEYGKVIEIAFAESLYNDIISGAASGKLSAVGSKIESRLENDALIISDPIFKSVSETVTPQGVLAVVEMPCYRFNEDFLEQKYKKDGYIKFIILENVTDPGNIGTMIRTGEAAGITGIILSKGSADIFNPKVVRSTMGSIFRVPFMYVDELEKEISRLKKLNIRIYATHLKGEKSYKDIEYGNRVGILIGNEAHGLSDEIAKLSDTYVKIPMKGQVESLNASIAAALMMFEA